MGLATIDLHSRSQVQSKLFKIPKFGVNRSNSKQDRTILKCQNLQRSVCLSGRCPNSVRMAIHFFVNFDVFKSLYLSQN